jgi:phosphoglycolate phosphatase-like HAD superfamily hydrolase
MFTLFDQPDPRRRVMLDVDGVLFGFTAAFSEYLGRPFTENDMPGWQQYPFAVSDRQRYAAMHYAHRPDVIERHGLYPQAVEQVARLRAEGLHVSICTHRARKHAEQTAAVLRSFGLEFDGYAAGMRLDKIAFCREQNLGVFVDDKPSAMDAAAAAGLTVIAPRWSYNADRHDPPRVTLVDGGWVALADSILAAALS